MLRHSIATSRREMPDQSLDTKDTKDTKEIHYRFFSVSFVSFVSALWRSLEEERRRFDTGSQEPATIASLFSTDLTPATAEAISPALVRWFAVSAVP